jgi:tripartite-type tricarboxylate transporter receptor subunit TctC
LFFNTLALVVNSTLKVKTIPELVALSKARPGTLSYGTFAFPLAYFMEKLKKETGADIVRVPFRGGGELVNAVLSGSTPVAVLALSNMISHLQSGRITGLAVNSKTRTPLFPDIPTLTEAHGAEQYPATWFGLFAPAGTPKPIIAKLAHEVARIIDERDFRQRMFVDRAVEPTGMRLEELLRFIRDERRRAERIVNESGLTVE